MKKTVLLIGLFVLILTLPCMGRYFDPTIGRWLIPDPLAGKYPSISPYVYCVNNPLKFVDPDGMDVLDKLAGKRISLKRFKNISVEMVRSIQEINNYLKDNSVELHFYIELYQNESGSWQFRNVENDREDQPEK